MGHKPTDVAKHVNVEQHVNVVEKHVNVEKRMVTPSGPVSTGGAGDVFTSVKRALASFVTNHF